MPVLENLTVPVRSFQAASAGFCSIDALTNANLSSRVTLADASTGPNQRLKVSNTQPNNKKILLNFSVVPAPGTTGSYTVCGFAVTNDGLKVLDGDSPNNPNDPNYPDFSLYNLNGNTVGILNNYKRGKKADGTATRWTLYILVTDGNGTVGVIDPEIDNIDQP